MLALLVLLFTIYSIKNSFIGALLFDLYEYCKVIFRYIDKILNELCDYLELKELILETTK